MKISPWFLAFILLSSIAVYALLDSTRIIELLTLKNDMDRCNTIYKNCISSGREDSTKCVKDRDACSSNATPESSHMITGFSNYPYLQEAFNATYNPNLSPPPGSNVTVPNSTDKVPSSWPWDQVTDVLSPDVSEALKTLRNALNGTIPGTTSTMVTAAEYTPNSNSVLPTYIPIAPQPSIVAVAPTDVGTEAEAIVAGSTMTPSVRQMIRNDISGAVKKEFEDINSMYQIQYNYE